MRGRRPGIETLRYILASLALGLIAVWGNENLFWSAPPPNLAVAGWVATWIAYALASAAALSAVGLTGIVGLRALFLGGVLLGLIVEGVVVDEMYLAFPFQLVWTPLAWHGLITGVCVVGLGRAAPHWRLSRHLGALIALGLYGAVFASFWPADRGAMPPGGVVLFYLAGAGLVVVPGQAMLDRIGTVPRPPLWVALIVPGLVLALWLAKTIAMPDPVRLAFPAMAAATLWAMWRLGGRGPVSFGLPAPLWRHFLFPLAPALTALIAVPIWENAGALEGNAWVAAVTVPVSLGWWLWLMWRAARAQPRSAASASDRSSAPS